MKYLNMHFLMKPLLVAVKVLTYETTPSSILRYFLMIT